MVKKPAKVWDIDVDNTVISKLVETKNSSKYLIGHLDDVIRPLALILPQVSGYVKRFKKNGEDKNKNNKLMSLGIYDEKRLEKYKTIWTKIEDFKKFELDPFTVFDDRYIKTKIRTGGDKVYTNFCALNVPEVSAECESLIIILIDFLLVYDIKYYL